MDDCTIPMCLTDLKFCDLCCPKNCHVEEKIYCSGCGARWRFPNDNVRVYNGSALLVEHLRLNFEAESLNFQFRICPRVAKDFPNIY